MSIADETDLKVTAELLRAGLLPTEDVPQYPVEDLKAAIAAVANRLNQAAYRRP